MMSRHPVTRVKEEGSRKLRKQEGRKGLYIGHVEEQNAHQLSISISTQIDLAKSVYLQAIGEIDGEDVCLHAREDSQGAYLCERIPRCRVSSVWLSKDFLCYCGEIVISTGKRKRTIST